MDIMICRHCRRRSDRPMIFSHSQQKVFDFIWDHPGASMDQLREAYVTLTENHMNVIISQIRRILADTDYALVTTTTRPCTYAIVKVPADANV